MDTQKFNWPIQKLNRSLKPLRFHRPNSISSTKRAKPIPLGKKRGEMGYRRIKERRSAIASKPTKAPFGWSDNRRDEKRRKKNRGENIIFPCLVQERKHKE